MTDVPGPARPSTVVRHRWMARGEREIPPGPAWLTAGEAGRLAQLRFTKRRTEYLLRRWVGKQAVAAVSGLSTDEASLARIEVRNHPGGAPYVLVDGRTSDLEVSLSDRAGFAVCLVGAQAGQVGCDLEIVEPRSEGFVADFLTPLEQEYVAAQDEPDAAANLLWSAKESALKVLRTGLRRDTRSVEVTVLGAGQDGWGRLRVASADGRRFPGWWRRDGRFLLTATAVTDFPPPEELTGSTRLVGAEPVHSWVDRPVVD